jgi:amino acid transporter
MVGVYELFIVLIISACAYFLLFNNFEKHQPLPRRITKLFLLVGILGLIGVLFSRYVFWGLIVLMTIGQVILHGWYFPKHGVNGLTAEPDERYLALIEEMKEGKKKDKN